MESVIRELCDITGEILIQNPTLSLTQVKQKIESLSPGFKYDILFQSNINFIYRQEQIRLIVHGQHDGCINSPLIFRTSSTLVNQPSTEFLMEQEMDDFWSSSRTSSI